MDPSAIPPAMLEPLFVQHPNTRLRIYQEEVAYMGRLPEICRVAHEAVHLALKRTERNKKDGSVGVAFCQIGSDFRGFIYYPDGNPKKARLFINPSYEPDRNAGFKTEKEGCLSYMNGHIARPVRRFLRLRALALEIDHWTDFEQIGTGVCKISLKPFNQWLGGWEARIWQHEVDHCNGTILRGAVL